MDNYQAQERGYLTLAKYKFLTNISAVCKKTELFFTLAQ